MDPSGVLTHTSRLFQYTGRYVCLSEKDSDLLVHLLVLSPQKHATTEDALRPSFRLFCGLGYSCSGSHVLRLWDPKRNFTPHDGVASTELSKLSDIVVTFQYFKHTTLFIYTPVARFCQQIDEAVFI